MISKPTSVPCGLPDKCLILQYSLLEHAEILNQYADKDYWGADQSWETILEWQLHIPELLKSSGPHSPLPARHEGHLLLQFDVHSKSDGEAGSTVLNLDTVSWLRMTLKASYPEY